MIKAWREEVQFKGICLQRVVVVFDGCSVQSLTLPGSKARVDVEKVHIHPEYNAEIGGDS